MATNITTQVTITARDLASAVFKNVSNEIKTVGGNIKSYVADNFQAGGIAAAGLGAAIVGVGAVAVNSAAKFESMAVSLNTAFQGNEKAANQALSTITAFATRTPFQLEEVLRGFVKLKNMGLDPSEAALTSYGDTASAMGKSLNDMVEAVADAATGEFERLKEFGIRASSQGDKVTFTFQGVKTTVGKNAKEIEDYLIKLGQTKFAGGMEAQSKTFNGMMSTMKDTFALGMADIAKNSGLFDVAKDALRNFLVVSEKAVPVITKFIKAVTSNKEAMLLIAGAIGGVLVLAIGAFVVAFGGALTLVAGFALVGAAVVQGVMKIIDIFNKLKPILTAVKDSFAKFKEGVKANLDQTHQNTVSFGERMKQSITDVKTAFQIVVDVFRGWDPGAMMNDQTWSKWQGFATLVQNIKDSVVKALDEMIAFFSALPGRVMAFMSKFLLEDLPYAFGYMVGFIVFKTIELVTNVVAFFQQLPGQIMNIWNSINVYLTNTMTSIRDFVVFKALELLIGVISFFQQLPGQIANIFNNMVTIMKNLVSNVVSYVISKFNELVNSVVSLFNQLPGIVSNAFNSMRNNAISIANDLYNGAVNTFNNTVNSARNIFNQLPGIVSGAIGSIPGIFSGIFGQIAGIIGGALQNAYNVATGWLNSLRNIWNSIIDGFRSAQNAISGGLRTQSTAGNATGAIVPGAIGQPRMALVHGGEEIVPFGRTRGSGGGGGGITLNVNIGLYAGSETEKRNVAQELFRSLMVLAKSQNKTVNELIGT